MGVGRNPIAPNESRRSKRIPLFPTHHAQLPTRKGLKNFFDQINHEELAKRGVAFVRYADDIAIFVGSERAAKRILASVMKWIEVELKIEVNRDKSGTGPSQDIQLLGFRTHREGEVHSAQCAQADLFNLLRSI